MNRMLARAVEEASRLPEDRQEALGHLLLEEMEAERGWEERFAATGDKLAELARRARERHARGETSPLVFPDE